MTITDIGLSTERVVDVDGIPMSARMIEVPNPRAVVVAVHGGATTSLYFDSARSHLSLLQVGAALGFTVIALDRPGYGASAPHQDSMADPARRIELAYSAVDTLLDSRPQGAGMFLMAHSAGSDLALRMAGEQRGGNLLGLELAGTGLRNGPETAALLEASRHSGKPTGIGELLWRPNRVYPADVVSGGAGIYFPAPKYERAVVEDWVDAYFPALAAKVRVPVQFSHAEHEHIWMSDPESLAEIGALFTAAPRFVTNRQANNGHNLSVGYAARAYHLKVLSFVEECVVARVDVGVDQEEH